MNVKHSRLLLIAFPHVDQTQSLDFDLADGYAPDRLNVASNIRKNFLTARAVKNIDHVDRN